MEEIARRVVGAGPDRHREQHDVHRGETGDAQRRTSSAKPDRRRSLARGRERRCVTRIAAASPDGRPEGSDRGRAAGSVDAGRMHRQPVRAVSIVRMHAAQCASAPRIPVAVQSPSFRLSALSAASSFSTWTHRPRRPPCCPGRSRSLCRLHPDALAQFERPERGFERRDRRSHTPPGSSTRPRSRRWRRGSARRSGRRAHPPDG